MNQVHPQEEPHRAAGSPPEDSSRLPVSELKASQSGLGTNLTAYLLAGPLAYGGLGFLADRWLGTAYLVVVGALLGIGLSVYVIWLRYGRS